MKTSEIKIGQKVTFTQTEETNSYHNYYGSSTGERHVGYVGIVKEIVSKQCVIVEVGFMDDYPVEPRRLRLIK
jgi:hypothetical protein